MHGNIIFRAVSCVWVEKHTWRRNSERSASGKTKTVPRRYLANRPYKAVLVFGAIDSNSILMMTLIASSRQQSPVPSAHLHMSADSQRGGPLEPRPPRLFALRAAGPRHKRRYAREYHAPLPAPLSRK
jgi:hypothetical protein